MNGSTMTIDEEVEEFLEHFGVRGMKWGVKKARSGVASYKRNKKAKANKIKAMTPAQRSKYYRKRQQNIGRAVQFAAVAGVGAVFVGRMIAEKRASRGPSEKQVKEAFALAKKNWKPPSPEQAHRINNQIKLSLQRMGHEIVW